MAPATTKTAVAGPGLVVHHADRRGALPQLWHLSRCHGASGPSEFPSGLRGPALCGLSKALPGPAGATASPSRGLPAAPAVPSGWAPRRECRLGLHQGEHGPRVPGSSASLDWPFLTVAFPNSASSAPPSPPRSVSFQALSSRFH